MTSTLPLPITTSNASDPLNSLAQNLDDLLERYLLLLHQYQTLQTQLSQTLSSSIPTEEGKRNLIYQQGYLSLAQANFQSSNRAHYGQDFYDDRMQASTRISINPSLSPTAKFSFLPIGAQSSAAETSSSVDVLPLSESTPSTPLAPRDPLTWFGILVPPALRQAQNSFKPVAEKIAPQMASVSLQMREVEIEVRRARKRVGKLGKAG